MPRSVLLVWVCVVAVGCDRAALPPEGESARPPAAPECTWDGPRRVARGVAPSIVAAGRSAVLAFGSSPDGAITVLYEPGGPGQVEEILALEAPWPQRPQLHRVNGALQVVAYLRCCDGVRWLERTEGGWVEDPRRGFPLSIWGSTSTPQRLVVHGCEHTSPPALAIHIWDGASWSRSHIAGVCFFPVDPCFGGLFQVEHDGGLAGHAVHVAVTGTNDKLHADLALWHEQPGGWVRELVQARVNLRDPDSVFPVLARQGCCDRLAYVAPVTGGETEQWFTIRLATRAGTAWSYTDLGEPFYPWGANPGPNRPMAMAVVEGVTHLAVLRPDAVVVHRGAAHGWQEQRFEVATAPASADLVLDGEGTLHLVYELEEPGEELNSIYYARQTCQPASTALANAGRTRTVRRYCWTLPRADPTGVALDELEGLD